MSRRQIVDTPPAHLQAHETNNQQPKSRLVLQRIGVPLMNIKQIDEPRCRSPRFFRVPAPIVSPSIFCPYSAKQHANSDKSQAYVHQIVGHSHFSAALAIKHPQCCQQCRAHNGIGEHINNYVRRKPRRLKRRHKRFTMNFGFEKVDTNKNYRHDCGKA